MLEDHSGPLSGVVWDLDGTLVDSAADIARTLNELLHECDEPPLDDTVVRGMIGDGVSRLVRRGFAQHGSRLDDAELREHVNRFMRLYERNATASTRLFPGALEALREFSSAGLPQAICTNKPEAITRQILADLDVADYFRAVVGGDTVPFKKPAPEPLLAAMAGIGVEPMRALLIGDSEIDVAAARSAGTRVAILAHGYSRVPAGELGADMYIEELADLATIVLRLSEHQPASAILAD